MMAFCEQAKPNDQSTTPRAQTNAPAENVFVFTIAGNVFIKNAHTALISTNTISVEPNTTIGIPSFFGVHIPCIKVFFRRHWTPIDMMNVPIANVSRAASIQATDALFANAQPPNNTPTYRNAQPIRTITNPRPRLSMKRPPKSRSRLSYYGLSQPTS